jgi:hypothetical protein
LTLLQQQLATGDAQLTEQERLAQKNERQLQQQLRDQQTRERQLLEQQERELLDKDRRYLSLHDEVKEQRVIIQKLR